MASARAVKLTADQWDRVKTIFLQSVPEFFPNDCMLPVFVPLNVNVLAKLEDLQQEKEELQNEMKEPAPAAYPARVGYPFHSYTVRWRWTQAPAS